MFERAELDFGAIDVRMRELVAWLSSELDAPQGCCGELSELTANRARFRERFSSMRIHGLCVGKKVSTRPLGLPQKNTGPRRLVTRRDTPSPFKRRAARSLGGVAGQSAGWPRHRRRTSRLAGPTSAGGPACGRC